MTSDHVDAATGGGIGLTFLLNELRDLRKGMESRDESIRGSMDGVRESVNLLSAKVDRSQGDVDVMRNDMNSLRDDVHAVRSDVDSIIKTNEGEEVRRAAAWSGPKSLVINIILLGSCAGALLALWNFWPFIASVLPAIPQPPSL